MTMTISITIADKPTQEEVGLVLSVLLLTSSQDVLMGALKSVGANVGKFNDEEEDDDTAAEQAFGAAPPPPAGPVALDTSGLPWDARIHSGNKTQNKDGSWKNKKNVDDATHAAVAAELRAVHPATPRMDVAAHVAASLAAPPPPPPPPTAAIPPPPPPSAAGGFPFGDLMKKITPLLANKQLTQAELLQAAQSVGLTSVPELAKRTDLIPDVSTYIDMIVASKQ